MNIEFIGIYWSPRYQSIEDCAKRVEQTFKFLQQLDQSFTYWYSTLKPKKTSACRGCRLLL
ncbi:Imm52 family immunity protein [Chitinophaga sancti]|uniref:Imm52 family immunity protein n=1 Tax=Chitinophaga sancti TaxID=1004 RepID=UPI0039BEB968